MTLPYDQIPPERRTIGGATGRLGEHTRVLDVALAQWMARDDSKAQPEVRWAANTAMDEIDAMLRELHALRARLISEIRASDDASAARADELLRRRQRPPRGVPRHPVLQHERGDRGQPRAGGDASELRCELRNLETDLRLCLEGGYLGGAGLGMSKLGQLRAGLV